ncbi:unnamed protein product [Closterium sp. NIES-64]|nr:unnamed protein product [Closterium sp. NIES-64]
MQDYEFVTIDLSKGEQKSAEFKKKQPFGVIPVLEDEDVELFESRAIARYVADKYAEQGTNLLGSTLKERALVNLWLEVESQNYNPPISGLIAEKIFKPRKGLTTDEAKAAEYKAKLSQVLDVYEARLASNDYLAGSFFSLADLVHLPYTAMLWVSGDSDVVGLGASGRAAARLALARGAAAVIGLDRRTDAKALERGEPLLLSGWLDRRTDAKALEAGGAATMTGLDRRTGLQCVRGSCAVAADGTMTTWVQHCYRPGRGAAAVVGLDRRKADAKALEGVPMLSELAFAYDSLPPGMPIAAVTGTNGKSTVATFAGQVMMTWQVLTWNILESIGIHTFVGGNLGGNLGAPFSLAVAASSHLLTLHAPFLFPAQILESIGIHTFVGGNLGTPLSLAALECVMASQHALVMEAVVEAAVVEVSSYQMELPGRFRPKAAVILNLTPDHLERHGNMESYGAAKCHLFARMGESEVAIIPSGDPLLMQLAWEVGGHPSMAWLGKLPGCTVNHAEGTTLLLTASVNADSSSYESSTPFPLSFPLNADDPLLTRLAGEAGGHPSMAWLGQLPGASADSGRESSSGGRESKESSKGHGSSTGDQAPVLALDLSALQAVGRHNAENAAVAALLCLALGMESSGVRLEGVQNAVKVLQPPPHRMELVVVDGQDRAWINDSKATNVEASTAGIEGLGDESTAVILLGGIAKVFKSLAATDEGGASDASPLGFSKLVPRAQPPSSRDHCELLLCL